MNPLDGTEIAEETRFIVIAGQESGPSNIGFTVEKVTKLPTMLAL